MGLGNPGREYTLARHNVGFVFIKELAKKWNTKVRKRRYLSRVVVVERGGERILLAMPVTFMNRSGEAVRRIKENCRMKPEQFIVVYDDFDIPLGEIRVRKGGSGGTHNGMKSIIRELDSTHIPRIRVGIGPVTEDMDPVEFVLSPFREEERALLRESLFKSFDALEFMITGKIEEAMNLYN